MSSKGKLHNFLMKLGFRNGKKSTTAEESNEQSVEEVEKLNVHPLSDDPDKAWLDLKLEEVIQPVDIQDCLPKQKSKSVRFVCISDTHSLIEGLSDVEIPNGDVLLHCGDFTLDGMISEVRRFNDFMGKLPHAYKVVIAGNHDDIFDLDRRSAYTKQTVEQHLQKNFGSSKPVDFLSNCIYLQDELIEIMGIKIYGTPWVPEYVTNGFALKRGQELLDKWNKIPPYIDVLMTHVPPLGAGDLSSGNHIHVGCVDLMNVVQKRVKPRYHVFGHIHEGYGMYSDGRTTFINASVCTRNYQPINKPIVFDLDIPKGHHRDVPVLKQSKKRKQQR